MGTIEMGLNKLWGKRDGSDNKGISGNNHFLKISIDEAFAIFAGNVFQHEATGMLEA